jgi:hypothetical protein
MDPARLRYSQRVTGMVPFQVPSVTRWCREAAFPPTAAAEELRPRCAEAKLDAELSTAAAASPVLAKHCFAWAWLCVKAAHSAPTAAATIPSDGAHSELCAAPNRAALAMLLWSRADLQCTAA